MADGSQAVRTAPKVPFAALSRAGRYAGSHAFIMWSLAGLVGAAIYISSAGLWGSVAHRVGVIFLLSLPVILVAWLVIEAEKARQTFRPSRTCRRR